MSPGAVIAVTFWLLAILWLGWEIWRAPTLDDDPTPHGRRHA